MNQSMNEIMNELKNKIENEADLSIENACKDKNIDIKNINRESIESVRRRNEKLENPKYLFEISRKYRMKERLQEKLISRMNPKK